MTLPSATAGATIGPAVAIWATVCRTFCLIALVSRSPAPPRTASTAGLIGSISAGRWPGSCTSSSTTLIAAPTAPQALWPSTMIKGVPSSATAYSMLARLSVFKVLPATRRTNSWPRLWSKASSGATRESAQPRITANGRCDSASATRSVEKFLGTVWQQT